MCSFNAIASLCCECKHRIAHRMLFRVFHSLDVMIQDLFYLFAYPKHTCHPYLCKNTPNAGSERGLKQKDVKLNRLFQYPHIPRSTCPGRNLRSTFPQPLFLLLTQRLKLFRESMRRCCSLEEFHEEALRLIISLPATARLFIRECHELLFAEAAA
jgi:hypothetical protein